MPCYLSVNVLNWFSWSQWFFSSSVVLFALKAKYNLFHHKVTFLQNIPPKVYKSSINLYFKTDMLMENSGWKMYYTVLPNELMPKEVSEGVFNCTVPHYYMFEPLFRCNMQVRTLLLFFNWMLVFMYQILTHFINIKISIK